AHTAWAPQSSSGWATVTVPGTGNRRPATSTWARFESDRGYPSAYPTGTVAIVAARSGRYVSPYDTPSPAGTRRVTATRLESVITGRRAETAASSAGLGDTPYMATPTRTMSKCVSGRRIEAALFAA